MTSTEQSTEEKMEVDSEGLTDDEKVATLKKDEGNVEYVAKRYREAISRYSEAITLHPTCASYYGNRAAARVMIKKYAEALEDAREAISIDKSFLKGYIRAVKCLMMMGQIEPMMNMIERGLEIDPKNKQLQADMRTGKGMLDLERQGADGYQRADYRKTEFCMRKLLEFAADCLSYKGLRAECLVLLKKYADAQVLANEILEVDGQNVEALYVRGLCLYYQDQAERAYKLFQQVLRLSPDFKKAREAYKNAKQLETTKEKGNEAFRKADYQAACDLYTQAVEIDPLNTSTNAKLYCNRATGNFKLKKHDDCIADCTKSIELDPAFLKPYLRRAKCYNDTEQYQEAVYDYEKISKMDRAPEYRHMLKQAKLELKKSQRKDYYKIMGLTKTATEDEIKKAYKREAMKHHPDRHGADTEEVQKQEELLFKDIGEAYSVLSDAQKKHNYDTGKDLEEGVSMADFDPNLLFQSFFGGGGGGGGGGYSFRQSSGGGGAHQGFPGGVSFSFG